MVRVDDSIFSIVGIGILHDDYGAAMLNLILIKRVLVFECYFNILAEKANVLLCEMFMFIIILFLD